MSWLYSRELVEEYSEAKCLDGEQCALWSGTHTQQASWLPAKTTKRSTLSRSGMTFKPLTDDLGEAVFQSCLEAFPVRTSHVQEKEPALTESDQVCGDTWRELSVKFDRNTSLWRTHQCLWEEDLPESSVTLPKWGMMQNGVLWERTTLPPLTSGIESGSLPTPRATDGDKGTRTLEGCKKDWERGKNKDLAMVAKMWPTPTRRDYKGTNAPEGLTRKDGKSRMDQLPNAVAYNSQEKDTGHLNPDWVEWLMGWPIGWTDLNALETDKFLMWPHTHGIY